jgi:hypothetical protein
VSVIEKGELTRIPELIDGLVDYLGRIYWSKLHEQISSDEGLTDTIPGFLIQPSELIFYLGPHHLGVEYLGDEKYIDVGEAGFRKTVARFHDLSLSADAFMNKLIGIDFVGTLPFPIFGLIEGIVMPTNDAVDELARQGWNWDAEGYISPINTNGLLAVPGKFARIIDGRFFDVNEFGLKTRHVKWLDLIPIEVTGENPESETMKIKGSELGALVHHDARYSYPINASDYRLKHLPRINRFLELIGNTETTEPEITRFLARDDYVFMLKMRFNASAVFTEITCEWQSQVKDAIRLDFLVQGTSGFADILEFKKPVLRGNSVVGSANRERLSAEINGFVAQTRVYLEYFDDPNNRAWVEAKYGIRVHKPRRFLVLGRRWDFESDEWRAISTENPNLWIMNYDDLIDGVVMQFYH